MSGSSSGTGSSASSASASSAPPGGSTSVDPCARPLPPAFPRPTRPRAGLYAPKHRTYISGPAPEGAGLHARQPLPSARFPVGAMRTEP